MESGDNTSENGENGGRHEAERHGTNSGPVGMKGKETKRKRHRKLVDTERHGILEPGTVATRNETENPDTIQL